MNHKLSVDSSQTGEHGLVEGLVWTVGGSSSADAGSGSPRTNVGSQESGYILAARRTSAHSWHSMSYAHALAGYRWAVGTAAAAGIVVVADNREGAVPLVARKQAAVPLKRCP